MASNALTAFRIDGTAFIDAVPSRAVELSNLWYEVSVIPERNGGEEFTVYAPTWSNEPVPLGRVSAAGIDIIAVLNNADAITYYNPYSSPTLIAWINSATNDLNVYKDGVLTATPRPTVGNCVPYGMVVSPDEQYIFWGGYGIGDLSVRRYTVATGVVDTIKTWNAAVVDQVDVTAVHPDSTALVGKFMYLPYSGHPTAINAPFVMDMAGNYSLYGTEAYLSMRGGSSSGTPGNACRGHGTKMLPGPPSTFWYSPEGGFANADPNSPAIQKYPRWSLDGYTGVYIDGLAGELQMFKLTGSPGSEVSTPIPFPAGWEPFSIQAVSDDGDVVWGSAQRLPLDVDHNNTDSVFRYRISTGELDTFDLMRGAYVWYTTSSGDTAVGDLGDGLWLFKSGASPTPSEYTTVEYEEIFSGGGVVNENYENVTGLGWLYDYTAPDGAHWADIGRPEMYVLTADGLVGLGWFDFIYRDIPITGSDYFVEIDFVFEEGVHPQALGIMAGQSQAALDNADWNSDSPSFTFSLGIQGADFWFEVGYDLGGGVLSTTNEMIYGAAAGSGVATMRVEIKGEFAHFFVNGQQVWLGGLRTVVGGYVGLNVSDLATVKAFRYGYSASGHAVVADFWQDLHAAKEIV